MKSSVHDIPPTGHLLFCSYHLTLSTVNQLIMDSSEMSAITLSSDGIQTEALQESLNKPRMYTPISKKVYVCMHIYMYVHAWMQACACKRTHACMCVHMKCLVYQLSDTCVDIFKALTQCSCWCLYSWASCFDIETFMLHLHKEGIMKTWRFTFTLCITKNVIVIRLNVIFCFIFEINNDRTMGANAKAILFMNGN